MANKLSNGNGNRGLSNGNGHKIEEPLNFASRLIASVPHGRKGKHNSIVAKIMADLERLDMETAILVPLDGMNGEKIANVRSALNRATKQKGLAVSTSTDDKYFYVWRTQGNNSSQATAASDRS
ncbi:MAG TPA: hypothetical protein VKW06_19775 [Candidatus Angelobacter sp.]|nr:hypothetical protein [Candidatus Angelobacter sp.]